MGQPRTITKTVTLAAVGGANTARCWDAPENQPYTNLSILVTSRGTVLPANDLQWDVYYGGVWTGTAFASDATHTGGDLQGNGAIAGGAAVRECIHTDAGIIPANLIYKVCADGGYTYKGLDGFPVVVLLTNLKASAITVYVTFTSECLSTKS